MKCKCTNVIPEGRLALGYRTCVKCSTTELYSYIPIIGNKQVLELQIVSQELSTSEGLKYKGYTVGELPPTFAFVYNENKETYGITQWFNYKGLTWIAE